MSTLISVLWLNFENLCSETEVLEGVVSHPAWTLEYHLNLVAQLLGKRQDVTKCYSGRLFLACHIFITSSKSVLESRPVVLDLASAG